MEEYHSSKYYQNTYCNRESLGSSTKEKKASDVLCQIYVNKCPESSFPNIHTNFP